MKRTPLQRKTPLRAKVKAGEASGVARRVRAGVPPGAPRNERGEPCEEKACVVCGEPFLAVWSQRSRRLTCSRKCAAEKKRSDSGKRRGRSNPNYRHGRDAGEPREARGRWRAAIAARCSVPGCKTPHQRPQNHHIVYRQHIRREGGDEWDVRGGMTLCDSCHASHHKRGRVVPLVLIPDAAYEFAVELLGAARAYEYLRRRYAGDDPRLDALLIASA